MYYLLIIIHARAFNNTRICAYLHAYECVRIFETMYTCVYLNAYKQELVSVFDSVFINVYK